MADGRMLSAVGYKCMWLKTKDHRSAAASGLPTKYLAVSCEKRIHATKKAAHAYDLIAETFGWMERHYEKSKTLLIKAAELRKDLGEFHELDLDCKEIRKKIADHANDYAHLFPCSDSKQSLLTCFKLWVDAKGPGPLSIVLVEKPILPEDKLEDRFYPPDLLPPYTVPEPKVKLSYERYQNLRDRKTPPFGVAGTKEIQEEMDVEPDSVSCIEVDKEGVSYFHQQWTWCTRNSRSEMIQRRWGVSLLPYASSPSTEFSVTPVFFTGPRDSRPFSFLNYEVYYGINTLTEGEKRGYSICEWKGTTVEMSDPDYSELFVSKQ